MTTDYPTWTASTTSQMVLNIVFGLAALATLVYSGVTARRERKLWPLFVFGGAALTVFYEPINNVLGHCGYPLNQDTLITVLGRHIPIFIGFVYMFYFGAPVLWLMTRYSAGITRRQLARYYAVAVVLCAAFEPAFVHLSMWRYYPGKSLQALDFTGLPMWWWFVNPMCLFAGAAVFHGLRTKVFTRDGHSVAFVPLLMLTTFATHGSASVPVFIAMNSSSGRAWPTVASLMSIALALGYMWVIGRTVCIAAPRDASGLSATRGDVAMARA